MNISGGFKNEEGSRTEAETALHVLHTQIHYVYDVAIGCPHVILHSTEAMSRLVPMNLVLPFTSYCDLAEKQVVFNIPGDITTSAAGSPRENNVLTFDSGLLPGTSTLSPSVSICRRLCK